MTNKLCKSPEDWREGRRLRAWELYQKGWKQTQIAEAFGFCGQVWTLTRVAEVIRREFGVVYHPGHVRRILRAIGWDPAEAGAPGQPAGRSGQPALV